ncbi:SAM-dependent methyltransferase [Pseudogemmobacter faecipullorum]|uniref:SAM-dependent methyltransferase n=1 Tax=Pseudogemmobacter faecipullorum TaxID=2755041 RepID=A0ABS8CHM8_9RHOB|nr:SAM-dependent methyltransferase [Pseudogemmobacter faecipullorum]MCB5408887.1 SAM-dependent methyltransferase [Pseudogemmobacter faecipullorum]
MAAPLLTDPKALALHRARALRAADPAFFLLEEAADEIQERLASVNRSFTAPVLVGGSQDFWARALRGISGLTQVPDQPMLGLAPGAHDAVIHAMALHWADDPVGQMVQSFRALKPDGLFLGLMFGGQTLAELRACLAEAEAEVTGGLSPRILPMAEIRDLGALLQRAGFALPVADSFVRQVAYRDIFHLMRDLRAMGETNALAARLRRPTRRAVFLRAAELYQQNFPAENGRILASFEVICLTGWTPHESQQKPLRPGSAAARLADALNATEHRLK